ncbi:MAG: DUF5675 family protein [Prevotella sp.]|nr:DUF5675 family protein [Prevotella sp.]MDD7046315.1 DUF5675 family protein [Prevotella sp.]MDY5546059.1 DUF5675 family protein [Prevotella sp.]
MNTHPILPDHDAATPCGSAIDIGTLTRQFMERVAQAPEADRPDELRLCLERTERRPQCTVGRLYCGQRFSCHTLEPPARHITLTEGTYPLVPQLNTRYDRYLPRVCTIHRDRQLWIVPGNSPIDTSRGILVGSLHPTYALTRTGETMESLMRLIIEAERQGKHISLEVGRV